MSLVILAPTFNGGQRVSPSNFILGTTAENEIVVAIRMARLSVDVNGLM